MNKQKDIPLATLDVLRTFSQQYVKMANLLWERDRTYKTMDEASALPTEWGQKYHLPRRTLTPEPSPHHHLMGLWASTEPVA